MFFPSWWWWDPWWGWGWGPSYYSFGAWWVPTPTLYPVPGYPVSVDSSEPAVVETDVHPRKATVKLDGEVVGKAKDYSGTWDSLSLAPGEHSLEFDTPGYQTLRVALNAKPGRLYRIDYDLKKGEGIDSRSVQPRDEMAAPAPLPEGDAGRGAVLSKPAGDEHGSLRRGMLKILADPPDAAVYLDGEFLASARELAELHGAIPVAEGAHRIEVVRPGYEAKALDVDVPFRQPVQVKIDLADVKKN